MKKTVVTLFVFLTLGAGLMQAKAQQIKIGSFDEESVLGLMPGIQKIDTLLQKFVEDSLKGEYEYELSEYKRNDSLLKDSTKVSASLKTILQKKVAEHAYKIQNWQEYQREKLRQKQEELLVPFRQKVYDALREIIADQKYTHVFKSEVFFAPIAIQDNLSVKVAKKLKLKLPAEVEELLKNSEGGSSPAATKPATGGTKPTTTKPR